MQALEEQVEELARECTAPSTCAASMSVVIIASQFGATYQAKIRQGGVRMKNRLPSQMLDEVDLGPNMCQELPRGIMKMKRARSVASGI